jgi:phosphoglycolate phosphatase-like HAD superfamily hydrolase
MDQTNKGTVAFLDFDDTCFNTAALKTRIIAQSAQTIHKIHPNIPLPLAQDLVAQSFQELKRLKLDPQISNLSEQIVKELSHSGKRLSQADLEALLEKVTAAVNQTVSGASDLVFPELPNLLEYATKLGWKLVILTHGQPEFQQAKVKAAKLDTLEAIFVTDHNKADAIKAWLEWRQLLLEHNRLIFVDDKAKYLAQVQEQLPTVCCLLIDRKHPNLTDRLKRTICNNRVVKPEKTKPEFTVIHNLIEIVD